MISYRRVHLGNGNHTDLPVDIADALERNARDLMRHGEENLRASVEADCRAAGYDPKTLPKSMSPAAALRIHFGGIRERIGPDEMARRYPCRTCAVAYDDTYKGECKRLGVAPCFMGARFKGCPLWRPKAEVGKPIPDGVGGGARDTRRGR